MNKRVQLACETKVRTLSITDILPMRKVSKGTKATMKYRQIAASVREVGIIEPLVVYPQNSDGRQFILLDGHIRLEILKELGADTVDMLGGHR